MPLILLLPGVVIYINVFMYFRVALVRFFYLLKKIRVKNNEITSQDTRCLIIQAKKKCQKIMKSKYYMLCYKIQAPTEAGRIIVFITDCMYTTSILLMTLTTFLMTLHLMTLMT